MRNSEYQQKVHKNWETELWFYQCYLEVNYKTSANVIVITRKDFDKIFVIPKCVSVAIKLNYV